MKTQKNILISLLALSLGQLINSVVPQKQIKARAMKTFEGHLEHTMKRFPGQRILVIPARPVNQLMYELGTRNFPQAIRKVKGFKQLLSELNANTVEEALTKLATKAAPAPGQVAPAAPPAVMEIKAPVAPRPALAPSLQEQIQRGVRLKKAPPIEKKSKKAAPTIQEILKKQFKEKFKGARGEDTAAEEWEEVPNN